MKAKKWVFLSCVALVVFLLLAATGYDYYFWTHNYSDRVYPGTFIGNNDLSGLTYDQVRGFISGRADQMSTNGLKFQYHQKQAAIASAVASFDSDLSYPALVYDAEASAQAVFNNNNHRGFAWFLFYQLFDRGPRQFTAVYTLDETKIKSLLADAFPGLNIAPINAYFSWSLNGDIRTNPETPGKVINYGLALSSLRLKLDNLDDSVVNIETQSQYPTVAEADLKNLEPQAENYINNLSLTLRLVPAPTNTSTPAFWTVKPTRLITWLSAKKQGNDMVLTLDPAKIEAYLNEAIAPSVNQAPLAPRFMIQDGRVAGWQSGLSGQMLDASSTATNIINNFLNKQSETDLVIQTIPNENIGDNELNIKEIIGTGHSHFAGSPVNRRHNIQVGADAVNGLLIKPGDEFSLVKALGNVDASTGYLPELVIKGDKTTPEYGGGLCQIGTTLFRAALASGLPITYRQNHSYRVSYYEPAGMDAAVYIPQPDVRFVNNTGNYILIQVRTVKDDIYFDFWGTSDGRVASTTTPVIYNIVKPEPTKYLVSPDLKPGEKKCTESSHNGADAYFDYTVTYAPGSTTTPTQIRRFKSHYVPWQAVCLIGATSTPAIASSSVPVSSSSASSSNSTSSQKTAE